jgi:hypothetical protein
LNASVYIIDVDWDDIDRNMMTSFYEALLRRSNYGTAIKALNCPPFSPPEWARKLLEDGGIICVKNYEVHVAYGL